MIPRAKAALHSLALLLPRRSQQQRLQRACHWLLQEPTVAAPSLLSPGRPARLDVLQALPELRQRGELHLVSPTRIRQLGRHHPQALQSLLICAPELQLEQQQAMLDWAIAWLLHPLHPVGWSPFSPAYQVAMVIEHAFGYQWPHTAAQEARLREALGHPFSGVRLQAAYALLNLGALPGPALEVHFEGLEKLTRRLSQGPLEFYQRIALLPEIPLRLIRRKLHEPPAPDAAFLALARTPEVARDPRIYRELRTRGLGGTPELLAPLCREASAEDLALYWPLLLAQAPRATARVLREESLRPRALSLPLWLEAARHRDPEVRLAAIAAAGELSLT